MKKKTSADWARLDNAAKIFPPTSTKRDTKVFRFACELTQPVEAAALQQALLTAVKSFPFYLVVLRHGMFWYYFEHSDIQPVVHQEDRPPCSAIFDRNKKTLLFEVTYFHNRINLEVYHALSDGNGALQFLRVLLYEYLMLEHPDELKGLAPIDYDATFNQRVDDSFQKYYTKNKQPATAKLPRAYRLHHKQFAEERIKVVEGLVSAKALLAKAREFNTTLTVLLTAMLLYVIHGEVAANERKYPIAVTVPVNLRNYFPSVSARNFFSVINVAYDFEKNSGEFADVIAYVDRCFKKDLTVESLSKRINGYAQIEHNPFARIVPLFFKDIILRLVNKLEEKNNCCSLSNIGRITMPKELEKYIRLFDVFVSTNQLQLCLCSYLDQMVLTFTSPYEDADLEKEFFRMLTGMGIDVEITSNMEETGGRTV